MFCTSKSFAGSYVYIPNGRKIGIDCTSDWMSSAVWAKLIRPQIPCTYLYLPLPMLPTWPHSTCLPPIIKISLYLDTLTSFKMILNASSVRPDTVISLGKPSFSAPLLIFKIALSNFVAKGYIILFNSTIYLAKGLSFIIENRERRNCAKLAPDCPMRYL